MELAIIILYLTALSFIFCYSFLQIHLVYHYQKSKKNSILVSPIDWKNYPKVTVQLPVYNELYVVERLIDTVAAFDYPKDKLEIQVLDDSTDGTVQLVEKKVLSLKENGVNIVQIRRKVRTGFKAGALQEGLLTAKGEFIAIFDADFLPEKNFLKETIPYFENNVGVIQTRWGHLNKNYSLLTKLQAFGLDAHFSVEQSGRNQAGYFINFNGTAGVWRKQCIIDAGGWEADTLTEDLDLSYRAQLKGWEFKFLEHVEAPAELPAEINALKSQQFRWTKGAAETARKILFKVLHSNASFGQKIHATFHLMNSFIFVCVFVTAVLSVPILVVKNQNPHKYYYVFKIASIFLFGFLSLGIFYWASLSRAFPNRVQRSKELITTFPLFLSISMGLSLHNAIAVIEGYAGKKTPFIRTPKFNINTKNDSWKNNVYTIKKTNPLSIIEALLTLYFIGGIIIGLYYADFYLMFFHVLLALGFGMVAFYSIRHVRLM